MMIGNIKHLEAIQDKWNEEYNQLLQFQERYCNHPEEFAAEQLVLYQMQYIDSIHLDFREVLREFSNLLQKLSSNQTMALDDVIEDVEQKIDAIEERGDENGRKD